MSLYRNNLTNGDRVFEEINTATPMTKGIKASLMIVLDRRKTFGTAISTFTMEEVLSGKIKIKLSTLSL